MAFDHNGFSSAGPGMGLPTKFWLKWLAFDDEGWQDVPR
jgi:hypothetical protein